MEGEAKNPAIPKELTASLAKFSALMGLAIIFPLLGSQLVSGPLVNALLFIAVYFLDLKSAILVALVPSLAALSIGLLPAVLAPAIPFIMLGNVILVIAFYYLKDRNYWLGVAGASFFKYIFIYSGSALVINLFLKGAVAAPIALMLGWPQLLSALSGGVIAYLFLKFIRRI